MVTHVVTFEGGDHTVNIQFGERNLVAINVHFEPDLTLRNLRERLRLVAPHWLLLRSPWCDYGGLQYLRARGGIRPSLTVIRERLPSSIPLCPKSLSLTLHGETLQSTVLRAHCPGLTGPFYQCPYG